MKQRKRGGDIETQSSRAPMRFFYGTKNKRPGHVLNGQKRRDETLQMKKKRRRNYDICETLKMKKKKRRNYDICKQKSLRTMRLATETEAGEDSAPWP